MRANYDPWSEAARLAGLPPERALRALISLLDEIIGRRLGDVEVENIASRLVRLLPTRVPTRRSAPDTISIAAHQLAYWVFWFAFVVSLLVYQSHDWIP
jgi:hypothetical protein